jgi:hypothetical protein
MFSARFFFLALTFAYSAASAQDHVLFRDDFDDNSPLRCS